MIQLYHLTSSVSVGDTGRISGLFWVYQLSSCILKAQLTIVTQLPFYASYSSYWRRKAIYWSLKSCFWTWVWANTHIVILSMLCCAPLLKEGLVLSDLCRLAGIFQFPFPSVFSLLVVLKLYQNTHFTTYTVLWKLTWHRINFAFFGNWFSSFLMWVPRINKETLNCWISFSITPPWIYFSFPQKAKAGVMKYCNWRYSSDPRETWGTQRTEEIIFCERNFLLSEEAVRYLKYWRFK